MDYSEQFWSKEESENWRYLKTAIEYSDNKIIKKKNLDLTDSKPTQFRSFICIRMIFVWNKFTNILLEVENRTRDLFNYCKIWALQKQNMSL